MARQWRTLASFVIVVLLLAPSAALAQEREPSVFTHAFKTTLLDPTTYVPAVLTYDGTMRDWNTSQPFFRNGFLEANARFTQSGMSNDVAISYQAGRNQILMDSLSVLAVSAVHNFSTQFLQEALREQYPNHRKLVNAIGWIERSAMASAISYALAGPHYRQWQTNQRLANELGLK